MSEKQRDYHTDNKSFMVYKDWEELLEDLTDQETGLLFRALFAFAARGEEAQFKGALRIAFKLMRGTLDRDGKKWEETCAKRAESGSLGGRATRDKNQKPANAANSHQMPANASTSHQKAAKEPDIDIDTETDTDIETETDIAIETEKEKDMGLDVETDKTRPEEPASAGRPAGAGAASPSSSSGQTEFDGHFGDYVTLSEEQYRSLVRDFGEDKVRQAIEFTEFLCKDNRRAFPDNYIQVRKTLMVRAMNEQENG